MTLKIKKNILAVFAICFLLAGNIQSALAFDWVDFDATDKMDDILNDLGVNKAELKYSIRSMNVSRRKKYPPKVSLSFNPSDPVPLQKVTAVATPVYFMNDTQDLYFTWYLQTKDCPEAKRGDGNYNSKCDLNNDTRVNIEDYKIKAMRIIVSNDFEWDKIQYDSDGDNDGYEAVMGGDDQKEKKDYCYIHEMTTGDEYQLKDCMHFFPNAPHETTGDGSFRKDEESFWHTDPRNDDTAYTGNGDEANVAGLGLNEFTWTYEDGDKVGVAVEGISSDATQESDSSFRIMWALVNDDCPFPEGTDTEDTNGDGIDDSADLSSSYINDTCLIRNLIDPSEGGGTGERLSVNLSYSPENPINDPSEKNGDQLIIRSSILNAHDENYLNYKWEVFESDDPNPDSWDVALLKAKLPEATQTTGLNLNTFKFKLNMPEIKKYLKIKLTVTENVSEDSARTGHNDIIIPITQSSEKIRVFATSISDDLSMAKDPDKELCGSESDEGESINQSICPIAKNSIIEAEVSEGLKDYLWMLDGQTISNPNEKDKADEGANNHIFFPITGDIKEQHILTLTATDQETGEKINLSRTFETAEPSVRILSADEESWETCHPELLGYFIDLDGKRWDDWSENKFEAVEGYGIKLKAAFSGFKPENYVWFVNNEPITNRETPSNDPYVDEDGNLILPAQARGYFYDVSVVSTYSPDYLVNKALNEYWNMPITQLYEKTVKDSIIIEVKDSIYGSELATASTPKNKDGHVLANLISATPAYLAFLVRLVLTAFVMLFASGLILSFSPRPEKE